jgi:hypothetical protein
MLSETDLKNAEKKNYLSYFEDGILDIIAGLLVLAFGLAMVFDASTLFIFTWMPIMLYWPVKQVITLPRMGFVKFSPERQRKISRNYVLLIVAGTLSLLLGLVAFVGFESPIFNFRLFMRTYSLLLLGVVMAGAFGLISILYEIRRFMAYAVLVFSAWLAPFLFQIHEGVLVAFAGGLISLIGIVILVRFLNHYPLPAE